MLAKKKGIKQKYQFITLRRQTGGNTRDRILAAERTRSGTKLRTSEMIIVNTQQVEFTKTLCSACRILKKTLKGRNVEKITRNAIVRSRPESHLFLNGKRAITTHLHRDRK